MISSLRCFLCVAIAAALQASTTSLYSQPETEIAADTVSAGIIVSGVSAANGVGTGSTGPVSAAVSIASPVTASAAESGEQGYRDNTPLVTVDGRIMFFNSTRCGDRPWARMIEDSTRWDDDIYYRLRRHSFDGKERWSEAVNVGPVINTSADDGVAAISPNATRMYFVSLRRGWDTNGGPFYVAELEGASVKSVKAMGGEISRFFQKRDRSRNFNIYGAAIDAYERSFYFATTVHSSRSELEIWVSHFDGTSWGAPINLGEAVNAPGGSYSPFIAADGKTLYFASGRAGGYGGDDIYRATLDSNGVVLGVINLGPTINGEGDEAFFSIPAAGDRVYLSSTRNGVESLIAAPLEAWMRPGSVAVLSGTVVDSETKKPVQASIRIEDLSTDSLVYIGRTSDLDDRYSTVLRPGHTYGISISAPGYVFTSTHYTIGDSIDFLELDRDFELERIDVNESFTLHNIFFDYDSAELNKASANELRRLGALLAERKQLRIEVGGHTDNIGSDEYNDDLSARRARAVREYLVKSCGIEPIRVMSRGYGAKLPVATNDSEQGRQQNRRVAFTIINM